MGRTASGLSTVGNNILTHDSSCGPFPVSHAVLTSSLFKKINAATSSIKTLSSEYEVQVVDTVGLFAPDRKKNFDIIQDVKTYLKENVPEGFNLAIFVFKIGRLTYEDQSILELYASHFGKELSSISALVFTGCDFMMDEQRITAIKEFTKKYPMIAKFMKKGIHPVGFLDLSTLKPALREVYEQSQKADQENLRHLIYSCDEMKQIIKDTTLWEKLKASVI